MPKFQDIAPHIQLPLSKSMLTREITISALAGIPYTLNGASADSDFLAEAFKTLMYCRNADKCADIYIGDGAAPARFFIAAASSIEGCHVLLEGSEQLKKRPVKPLIDVLTRAGADITLSDDRHSPWIEIRGKKMNPSSPLPVDVSQSSQFLSALMLAAPLWQSGGKFVMTRGTIVSQPYLQLTLAMMKQHGICVQHNSAEIIVAPGNYSFSESSRIEHDWSAASYFYEYTAISGKPIFLDNLTSPDHSLQGDAILPSLFKKLGVSTQYYPGGILIGKTSDSDSFFKVDMTDFPDLVPALTVALCLNETPFEITGVSHLQHKESRRLDAIRNGLSLLGAEITGNDNLLEFSGSLRDKHTTNPILIDSCHDHRIAMAFLMARAKGYDIIVSDTACISKSFPGFLPQIKKSGL